MSSYEDVGTWRETDNPHRVKVEAKTACIPSRADTIVVELNWNSILFALSTFINGSDPKYWSRDAVNLLRAEAQKVEDEINT